MPARSVRAQLGDPPLEDTLAAVNWAQRLLVLQLAEILDDRRLTKAQKREETRQTISHMAKLQDRDRIYAAEKGVKDAQQEIADPTRGPQVSDAKDYSNQPRQVVARRGRPPRAAPR